MNYINAKLVLWPSKMRVESNVISVLHSSNKGATNAYINITDLVEENLD